MKINVGIVGYGNLGKAVEQTLLRENSINLVCIFSQRKNIVSAFGTPVVLRNKVEEYKGKIDLLVLCSGSQNQMLVDAPELAKNFDIINTFDTHNKIAEELVKIDKIAKRNKHMAIISCGWDPGVMSIMRTYFFAIQKQTPTTLWGPGTSLGHSDAVRKLDSVKDAISLTIPSKNSANLHKRIVYVVCDKQYKKRIRNQIMHMPNYFAGQNVCVHFVGQRHLLKVKKFNHAGQVICDTNTNHLKFECKMQSNPQFTAKIVLAFVCVFEILKNKYGHGAFVPLDFAPIDMTGMTRIDAIKNFC